MSRASSAETVVAPSAMTEPRTGPKSTPAARVSRVRGTGKRVISTYKVLKRRMKPPPDCSAQARKVASEGMSKARVNTTAVRMATKTKNLLTGFQEATERQESLIRPEKKS